MKKCVILCIIQNVELHPNGQVEMCFLGSKTTPTMFFKGQGVVMAVSYNKLWNLVRQNKMKKGDLARAAEISSYWMSKLNKDEPVQMEVMLRLCKVFHCDIGDLMEVIEE